MNEDENGVTPANVSAITVQPARNGSGWRVVIEQGNGEITKEIELTPMEAVQLGLMLSDASTASAITHAAFVDVTR